MDSVTKDLLEALKGYVSFGCPVCGGDCYSANPPQTFCLVKQACDAIARAEAALAEPQPDADGWISTDIIDYVRDAYAFISSVSPAGLAEEAFRLPPSSTRAQRAFLQAVQSDPLGKRATNPRQDPGGQSEDGGDVTRQPDADVWIPWAGGECPLPSGAEHFVRLRCGNEYGPDDDPEGWRWDHRDSEGDDIIAYRVVQEPK